MENEENLIMLQGSEGSSVCSVSEIRVVKHDHKFVAYSVLTKFLGLCKTENAAFLASRNYLSLIQFFKKLSAFYS